MPAHAVHQAAEQEANSGPPRLLELPGPRETGRDRVRRLHRISEWSTPLESPGGCVREGGKDLKNRRLPEC